MFKSLSLALLLLAASENPIAPVMGKPAAPSAAQLTATAHSATLTWTNPNSGGSITVLRANSCTGTFSTLTAGVVAAGPFTDSSVTAATQYAYEVEAVVNGATSSPSGCVSGTIPVFPVTGVNVAQGTSATQAIVSWTASTDAGTAVTVQRATGTCGATGQTFTTLTSSAPAGGPYTDNTIATATNYCYSLQAGIGGVESAAATFQFSSGVASPTGLTIVVQ